MKITFLGTGTSFGVPYINCNHPVCLSSNPKDKRLRSSILIEKDNNTFLIDCGPDFRQQMLYNNVQKIDAILFTHEHADHIAGLDDIRPFCQQQGALPIYAHQRVLDSLIKRFDYIFTTKNRYKGAPSVITNIITNNEFSINNQKIIPIDVLHGNWQVFGFRIDNFAYVTDVSSINKSEKQKLTNLDLLVLDSLRIEAHPTHFCLDEALALIDELKPKKAYLTHISHKLGFYDKVSKTLPYNVFLAYDNLKITL
jgi:phosphoribosyl 1,2-cyclic phosphate phosphodiesterase